MNTPPPIPGGVPVEPPLRNRAFLGLMVYRLFTILSYQVVAVTPKVKGIVDETKANFVGVVSGMAADGLLCEALTAADIARISAALNAKTDWSLTAGIMTGLFRQLLA